MRRRRRRRWRMRRTQGEEERPLEARFDLTQETEVRGDQMGPLEETSRRGDAGDDSDYEGEFWCG